MPFYEYECSACKYYTEVLQKISDAPLKKCPSCGKQTMKRLVSAPVFRLKGSGWYETDFKSEKEQKRNLMGEEKEAKESKESKEPIEPKGEVKADSKPAETAEKKTAEAKPAASESKPSKISVPVSKSTGKIAAKAKPAAKKKAKRR